MDSRKAIELERLMSDMFDDGASAEGMARLEALLADDPALQQRYWQFVSTHVSLGVATGGALQNDRVDGAFDSRRGAASQRPGPGNSGWGGSSTIRGYWRPLSVTVAAASVLTCVLGWLLVRERAVPRQVDHGPSVHWTVDRMPMVTHVSWDGPSFSQDENQWRPIAAVGTGSIALQVEQGRTADGYLFCLPPGASVELVATFDATGENCLSVAEIGGADRRPVRKATFNNSGVGVRPLHANPGAVNRRYGMLGSWSESNATSSPRYFLLTGSHKLAGPPTEADWQLSKMEVLLNQDDVIHLAWDDSGPEPTAGQVYRQDDDFDDLAASLFISRPGARRLRSAEGLTVVGSQDDSLQGTLPKYGDPYRFTLAAGEVALLKVSADASAPNAIYLIDAETGEVQWATSNRSNRSMNLGAAAIVNHSSGPRELLLVAGHQAKVDGNVDNRWSESTRKELYHQASFVILGYEDARVDNDFNDMRVSLLRETLPRDVVN